MIVCLVVAVSDNRVIGHENRLPWALPADLRHFKRVTMGHPLIMGRRTHESIGKALPGRQNIVVSRQPGYTSPGCIATTTLERAFMLVQEADRAMVIGGAELFARALPSAQRIYLTEVHARVLGDVYFPDLNATEWHEVCREDHLADDRNEHAFSFVRLERSSAGTSVGSCPGRRLGSARS